MKNPLVSMSRIRYVITVHRFHLAKDKNIHIVPEMICRVFGNSKNMFMIYSIEVKLASVPKS